MSDEFFKHCFACGDIHEDNSIYELPCGCRYGKECILALIRDQTNGQIFLTEQEIKETTIKCKFDGCEENLDYNILKNQFFNLFNEEEIQECQNKLNERVGQVNEGSEAQEAQWNLMDDNAKESTFVLTYLSS